MDIEDVRALVEDQFWGVLYTYTNQDILGPSPNAFWNWLLQKRHEWRYKEPKEIEAAVRLINTKAKNREPASDDDACCCTAIVICEKCRGELTNLQITLLEGEKYRALKGENWGISYICPPRTCAKCTTGEVTVTYIGENNTICPNELHRCSFGGEHNHCSCTCGWQWSTPCDDAVKETECTCPKDDLCTCGNEDCADDIVFDDEDIDPNGRRPDART